ncbi:hypothetical protein ACSNOK_35205, partial [Streptomyces sp. URMC 126]|uniref:hypothetical protein n=1 Tax=Streptomyces sp. URMC 126 TaxID=3423401 RepID=UPI003F1E143B
MLFERRPQVALRLLYDDVTHRWERAAGLLEHAVDGVVEALGTDAGAILHHAVLRALACASPDGVAPAAVDGVR